MQRVLGSAIAAALLLGLAGCGQGATPAPTRPPATHTPAPTGTTPATATASPSPTRTSTATPRPTPPSAPVGQIAFSGAPCSEMSHGCQPFDDTPTYYYVINSDGTGLERVDAMPSATTPAPPGGLPDHFILCPPQLSPDGSHLAYAAMGGLYIVDMASGETRNVFRPDSIPGSSPVLGPFCWTPDGSAVRFVVRSRENSNWVNTFYMIDWDGDNVRIWFTLTDLGGLIGPGDCSPGNQELAFSLFPFPTELQAGLYVINLDTGKWRKILADYDVSSIRAWPVEAGH